MDRLTDKDWHTTKFMGLNEREVLHRLWELENYLYKDTKFKVGDVVYFIEGAPMWKAEEERRLLIRESNVRKIYMGKTKVTYYVCHRHSGFSENRLYATKEQAEQRIEELKKENKAK